MEEYNKEMTIELKQSIYEEIEEYCQDADIEESELINDMLQCFIKDTMNKMDAMRKGYAEMGRINLEICSEFDGCENDIHAYI
ncbi:MAG: hypothetical protein L0J48_03355 [Alkalibacterium sp.]|uniref:hypothetical protein n=1 Tax=Alkalibacterium TaxID=99906 RepID=UPI002648F90C|nr:hypothetical protein [Alkalibacterium sp.]MDN6194778.1 hypothetical protein [Alkalibacterium sp.]MDN6293587.1 hypothetical protein [Alkalibacterium sp.]MDN6295298.1 hypothetical protein [Alkalibacterium sp.]MDN6327046.1 hypothetical protein [Alkalibacterium sp.]MDN6385655.1 hypothetical protein [Alkalibacterium sp.]